MISKKYKLSIRKQCKLLKIERSSYYYQSIKTEDTVLANLIAEIYARYPIYGYRRITATLNNQGHKINSKKVFRLMKEMNLSAVYPKPNTSRKLQGAIVFPYLLKALKMEYPNQAWQIDITYLSTITGFMYLVALIDVYSRFIIAANLSNNLCATNCLSALEKGIYKYGIPEIINSDQGTQFTSEAWINSLQENQIKVSMTGKGRCCDNAYIERLWRSFKREGMYLYDWRNVADLKNNIPKWINWYNEERPHQSLNYQTPYQVYNGVGIKSLHDLMLPDSRQNIMLIA